MPTTVTMKPTGSDASLVKDEDHEGLMEVTAFTHRQSGNQQRTANPVCQDGDLNVEIRPKNAVPVDDRQVDLQAMRERTPVQV